MKRLIASLQSPFKLDTKPVWFSARTRLFECCRRSAMSSASRVQASADDKRPCSVRFWLRCISIATSGSAPPKGRHSSGLTLPSSRRASIKSIPACANSPRNILGWPRRNSRVTRAIGFIRANSAGANRSSNAIASPNRPTAVRPPAIPLQASRFSSSRSSDAARSRALA